MERAPAGRVPRFRLLGSREESDDQHPRFVAAALLAAISSSALAAPPIEAQRRAFIDSLQVAPADGAAFDARCESAVALARTLLGALEGRKGPASIRSDFDAYDGLVHLTKTAQVEAILVSETNPSAQLREAATACTQKIRNFETAVSLSQPVYRRLAAIPDPRAGCRTAFTLETVLKRYRLGGVDQDAATRAKVAALQSEISAAGLLFDRNIREDYGDIALAPEELEGLAAES